MRVCVSVYTCARDARLVCGGMARGGWGRMKLADGREKPRRSEKRAGRGRRKGESWWGALERVEWVRGVSFEPLNFAKFETVRGRGDSPSDVHSASTLLLPPLLSLSPSPSLYFSLWLASLSISLRPPCRSLPSLLRVYGRARRIRLFSFCFLSSDPVCFSCRRYLRSSFAPPPLPPAALRRTLSAVVVLWKF